MAELGHGEPEGVAHGLFRAMSLLSSQWLEDHDVTAVRAGYQVVLEKTADPDVTVRGPNDYTVRSQQMLDSPLVRVVVGPAFIDQAEDEQWGLVAHEISSAVSYWAGLSPDLAEALSRFLRPRRSSVTWLSPARRTRHWSCLLRCDVTPDGLLHMHLAATNRHGSQFVVALPCDDTSLHMLPRHFRSLARRITSQSAEDVQVWVPARDRWRLGYDQPLAVTLSPHRARPTPGG